MRQNENALLDKIEELIVNGASVSLTGSDEYNHHVASYFNEYLDYFYSKKYTKIKVGQEIDETDTTTYFISKEIITDPWYNVSWIYQNDYSDDLIIKAQDLSSLMQMTRANTWIDGGARLESEWSIYKNVSKLLVVESNEPIKIGNGDPYAQFAIPIGEPILTDDYWWIEIEYETIHSSKPYVIVYGTPFSPDKLALHDEIATSDNETKSLRLTFRKNDLKLEEPSLVFRNWANQGEFTILKYSVYKKSSYYNEAYQVMPTASLLQ